MALTLLALACTHDAPSTLPVEASAPPPELLATPGWPGELLTFTLRSGFANRPFALAASLRPTAPPFCPPALRGTCMDIGAVTLVSTGVTAVDGGASVTVRVPPAFRGEARFQVGITLPGQPGVVSEVRVVTAVDPLTTDSDRDGLLDAEEFALGTNALSRDTDADGYHDGDEVRLGFDPLDPDEDGDFIADGEIDPDFDLLTNGVEARCGLDPNNPDSDGDGTFDPEEDSDNDGVINFTELEFGLDPGYVDTDGNGIDDGDEDFDGDGLGLVFELSLGSDPFRLDTDGDLLDDGDEVARGTSPTSLDSNANGRVDTLDALLDDFPLVAFVDDAGLAAATSSGVVLLDYTGLWCVPSRNTYTGIREGLDQVGVPTFGVVIHESSITPADITPAALAAGIVAFPTTALLQDGVEKGRFVGTLPVDDFAAFLVQLQGFATDGVLSPAELNAIQVHGFTPTP